MHHRRKASSWRFTATAALVRPPHSPASLSPRPPPRLRFACSLFLAALSLSRSARSPLLHTQPRTPLNLFNL